MSISVWRRITHDPIFVSLLALFVYYLLAGFFVQLIFLPHLAPPDWHDGSGMLAGTDMSYFHNIAFEAFMRIVLQGWSSWELSPGRQAVSGISSIFYTLIAPQPWSVLPWNALLNTLAVLGLVEILRVFDINRRAALLAALPFALFPSSLLWITQMHNENYSILGGMLLILGWIKLAIPVAQQSQAKILGALLCNLIGMSLIWLVRQDLLLTLSVLSGIAAVGLGWYHFSAFWKTRLQGMLFGMLIAAMILTLVFAVLMIRAASFFWITAERSNTRAGWNIKYDWQPSAWLPEAADTLFEKIAARRIKLGRSFSQAGSTIDGDFYPTSSAELLAYMPRAAQIALFSPFPSDWFAEGTQASNTIMRRVSGLEMILVYLSYPGLAWIIWKRRFHPGIWTLLLLVVGTMLAYAISMPNVGTLYRFRYGLITLLTAFGMAGWQFIHQARKELAKWLGALLAH
jgi:hypothetical protein